MMFDIDFFKKINDTYGHPAGDACCVRSQTVHHSLRSSDVAGRYGGEEFGVLLLDANAQIAALVAERLRQAIARLVIEHEGRMINLTISIGLAPLVPGTENAQQWLSRADQALYHSKHAGRNRVTLFGDTDSLPSTAPPSPVTSHASAFSLPPHCAETVITRMFHVEHPPRPVRRYALRHSARMAGY